MLFCFLFYNILHSARIQNSNSANTRPAIVSAWVCMPEIIHVLSEGDGWAGEVCKAVDYFVRSADGATLGRFLERTIYRPAKWASIRTRIST